jgi:hypothetical protein
MTIVNFLKRAAAEGRAAVSMIHQLSPDETRLYQMMRRAHCSAEKGSHECVGRLTVDAGGIVLQCDRCGCARAKNADHEEPAR